MFSWRNINVFLFEEECLNWSYDVAQFAVFFPFSHVHPVVSTLKEESSDESTIISSQTSTLTRNQGNLETCRSQQTKA